MVKTVNQDKETGQCHFDVSYDQTGQKVHEIIDEIMYKQGVEHDHGGREDNGTGWEAEEGGGMSVIISSMYFYKKHKERERKC